MRIVAVLVIGAGLTLSGVAAWAVASGRLGGSSPPEQAQPLASPSPAASPTPGDGTPAVPALGGPVLLYRQFGENEDTIWLVEPSRLDQPRIVATVPHVPFYGISASLSPDGRWLAYTVLPPSVPNPEQASSSESEVWLMPALGGEARRVASGADVRLAPLWSPDGAFLVFQRLEGPAGGPALFLATLEDGAVSRLADLEEYPTAFPIALSADGATLYLVATGFQGSELLALSTTDGSLRTLATVPTSIARYWSLSPDGAQMSFVALLAGEWGLWTVDLADGSLSRLEAPGLPGDRELFNPVWHPSGEFITVGAAPGGGDGGGVMNVPLSGGPVESLPGPEKGVDFPVGWSPGGDLLVVNEFAEYPPRRLPRLVLIDEERERRLVAGEGELAVIGWARGEQ